MKAAINTAVSCCFFQQNRTRRRYDITEIFRFIQKTVQKMSLTIKKL